MDHETQQALRRVAGAQHHIISRAQALNAGLTRKQTDSQLSSGAWQRVHPGVYATHSGPLTWDMRVWAGVLYAGKGAAASHATAAHLWGLVSSAPAMVSVCVPGQRTVVRQTGIRVVRRRRMEVVRRKGLRVTTVRQTVLDLCALPGFSLDEVAALLGKAAQRKLLDPVGLIELLDAGRGHPMSARLRHACGDAVEGVESSLESRILRGVIRGHGLSGFELQVPLDETRAGAGTPVGAGAGSGAAPVRRSDLRNRALGIRIEGDGLNWHGGDTFHADRRRDREAAAAGDLTFRITWDAAESPCQVALDLACAMSRRGWEGIPEPCGPACEVPERWSDVMARAAG